MSNVHSLFSGKKKKDDDTDDDNEETRYVGGVDARGGGSGLAVEPTHDNDDESSPSNRIFQLAEAADSNEAGNAGAGTTQRRRRTIIMYRNGFQVDEDGPYRRLDDDANAEFLRSLAMGRIPRELLSDQGEGGGDVVVNLVDKRNEDYVETFRSFSGVGTSLGSSSGHGTSGAGSNAATAAEGVFDPSTLPAPPTTDSSTSSSTTNIQVKLLNGKRKVIKISIDGTVETLASMLLDEATEPFRLVTGFPPQPLTNKDATIEQAGLKGAQVMMKKA